MAPVSAAKWCIINTTIHYVPLLDLVPSQGRKQSTFQWVFWNNTQKVVLERSEKENWHSVFIPVSELAFEIDNWEHREPWLHHSWGNIRKIRVHRLSSNQEKGNRAPSELEGKMVFDEHQRSKLPKSFDKEETKGSEFMKYTSNVSTKFLIASFYPEYFLQSLKSCFRAKRGNTIWRVASVKEY